MGTLVLSLFPGIGLLDMAFEREGYCVVRGPDVLWGGEVRHFHPPAGVFSGVIGGPPCKRFAQCNQAARKGLQPLADDLIPEYGRVVAEAQPDWFVMENVRQAPLPVVPGYTVRDVLLNNRWLGAEQNRVRRFSFGTRDGRALDLTPEMAALECPAYSPCFTANATQWDKDGGRSRSSRTRTQLAHGIRVQGLPAGFLEDAPFTVAGAIEVVGNGVPLPMGLAIARAVRRALAPPPQDPQEAQPEGDGAG